MQRRATIKVLHSCHVLYLPALSVTDGNESNKKFLTISARKFIF